jgi:26S proteasome regulatory subunit N1
MAKDGESAKSVDKGKGKSTDAEPSKSEEPKKDKDGKPLLNGKKEEGVIGGEWVASRLFGHLCSHAI